MTSSEQPLTSRELASGASDAADDNTELKNIETPTPANDKSGKDDIEGEKGQPNSRQKDADLSKKDTPLNSARDRRSSSKQSNRDAMTPMTSQSVRAPPEGRDRTPLPDISTNREGDKKSPPPVVDAEDSDEDDGGWGTKRSKQSKTDKSKDKALPSRRPMRAFLHGTSRTTHKEKTLPEPMSNNLVIRNGRLPAAWQQSTIFKTIKLPKNSPRSGGGKLPALSGRKNKGSPPRSPAKPVVQTTFRVDELIKRPNANIKKSKPKLAKCETNHIRLVKMVAKVGSDLLRLAFYNYLERQQPPKKLHQFLAANRRRLKSFAGTYKLITRRFNQT